jgi:hypothetical protein
MDGRMRIYIDEAGNFVVPADGQSLFSLVLALLVPGSIENDLFQAFLRLRDSWPNNAVEIKGSKLDESQAAQVIDLVSRYDVFVETNPICFLQVQQNLRRRKLVRKASPPESALRNKRFELEP